MALAQSLKAFVRENKETGTRGDGYSLDPRTLVEREGFNVRDYNDPEVIAHIEEFAEAFANGHYVPPITVKVVDGKPEVRDGHCRTRGALLAIERGHDIKRVRVDEFKGDEFAETALLLTSNDGLALKTLERVAVLKRMINQGHTEAEVADAIGKTTEHVRQMLMMDQMPIELKRMVNANQISATYALELFKEHGTKAVEVAQEALEKAKGNGRQKVTRKAVTGRRRLSPKVLNSLRDQMGKMADRFDAIKVEEGQKEVSVSMSVEEFEALKQAANQIKAAEASDDSAESGEGMKAGEIASSTESGVEQSQKQA